MEMLTKKNYSAAKKFNYLNVLLMTFIPSITMDT